MRFGSLLIRSAGQACALGLVFALAGFTFAVSTAGWAPINEAGGRAVGSFSALRFTNPLFGSMADEYDLGDATFGSVVTRYITADGGVRPYTFTSTGSRSFSNVLEGLLSSLKFNASGLVTGAVPASLPNAPLYQTAAGTPGLRFQVTVTDSSAGTGSSRSGFFNLALVTLGANEYRFATDAIPAGLLGAPYLSRCETLGSIGEQTFTLLSPTPADAALLGIFVSSDGTISGRPLQAGTFTLTVKATDKSGRIANNRQNSAPNQTYTLNVTTSTVTTSDLVTVQCRAKGSTSKLFSDSLQYKGLVNMGGVRDLRDAPVYFRVGGVEITGKLDKNGKYSASLLGGQKVSLRINARKGTLDARISKGSFATPLDIANLQTPKDRRPIAIAIGDVISTSEVLEFVTEKDASGSFALNYSLGRDGSSSAGAFQILSVKGRDGITLGGVEGDRWRVKFLAIPRVGISADAGIDNVTLVNVRVGQSFDQELRGIVSNSSGVRFRALPNSPVRSLKISSSKFTGMLDTNVLTTSTTGIPIALKAAASGNLNFPLGIELTRSSGESFVGESAKAIFPNKNKYADSPRR
jgi:hypothetical protein